MNKIVLDINGMMCGMCEAHVNDLFRRSFPKAKKITSSHTKNHTIIFIENNPSDNDLNKALEGSGYKIEKITREEAKKSLFGWK